MWRARALSWISQSDMAADPQPDWLSCLPPSWSYGVTRDGRIFFLSEEAQSSTWLHPATGEAVTTGHRKTPDLPTGWEEGYTFEGARCFINHNERKVTCKHPVSGVPSQDNCIFVVNEQPARKASAEQEGSAEQKERPMSIMSEASNYTGGSDYSQAPTSISTSTRPSRPSKKIHNFGKRSNSIKRNLNAPVVKKSWLYKQDSSGMKLWKKRWFVLSDLCLFYYRDEKEDSILGSILLPSFHISMLSVDDHISKKYAFKATHPNMRTYYFCTDTAKEMESWMKVMTDAALVHSEPVRRLDKLNVDQQPPQQWNNLMNHAVRTQPELQNNERNREPVRQESLSRADRLKDAEKPNRQREREYYTLQRDGEKYSLKKDGVSYMLQKDGERYVLHRDGERYLLRKDGEKYSLHKEVENYAVQKVNNRYTVTPTEEKYAPSKDGEKFLLTKDGERSALQKVGDRHKLQDDGHSYVPQKEVKRQLSLRETERYGTWRDLGTKQSTVHMVDKYGNLKEVRKYSTLREGNRYAAVKDAEKYATIRAGERYGFQMNPSSERSVTKISSITLQPAQAAAIAAAVSASRHNQAGLSTQNPPQAVSSGSRPAEPPGDRGQSSTAASLPLQAPAPVQEPDGGLAGSDRMQQLEARVRTQRSRELEDDTRSVTSYQTLPRNMPSHRTQTVHCYPAGYRTLPRNSVVRPDSICSVAGSVYDRALRPGPGASTAEKRRSLRDDTMWQLYEWQQRQAFCRQSLVQPAACRYGTLPSTKTMGSFSEHAVERCVSTSPSHGSLALYSTFSPPQQQLTANPNSSLSEVSSPVLRGDGTLERRQRSHLSKYGCPSDRRSIAAAVPPQTITPQSLQGKTPEELTLLLIKLRRQQAEINSLREHTVAQLMALGAEGTNAKTDVLSHHLQRNLIYLEKQVDPDDLPDRSPLQSTGEADVETKLSRLCEKDKVLRMQEEKLQQLHREKHTLEAALQSASQELGEQSSSTTAAAQSLVQQRDVLQSGLLGTCRELSRVSAELERSWTEYEQLEADVSLARTNLLEQLEALGSPQTEPPSQQHIQIQKELWRIQDVMEALTRTKAQQRPEMAGFPGSRPLSSQQKNEQAPDYRLYKSEPELTTVNEEGDEANSEDKDKTETSAERRDTSAPKAPPYPVGIVAPRTKSPLSTPESATIASYVTLRKTRKPESRSDRPRSTADQTGEREFIRTRMSVEEQLERMRRNQEASSLREKRRGTLSRSSSFNRDSTGLHLQKPEELQQEKAEEVQPAGEVQPAEEVKPAEDLQPADTSNQMMCGSQRVVIVDLGTEPKRVEMVNLHPYEDDESKGPDLSSSPSSITEISFQTPSPDFKEQESDGSQTLSQEELIGTSLDSYKQLTGDGTKRNINNMLAAQNCTLVSSDT